MRSSILIITMLLCIWATASRPRVFKVGDDFGWRVPLHNDTAVYSHWASTNRFHIGDSLAFVYEDKDSVMEVNKWGFYHCNGTDPITAFDNGNSTMELDRPGLFYFISGSNSHCTSGQRLIVQVMHIHHHTMPPSMAPLSAAHSAASSLFAPIFLIALSFLITLL